MLYTLHATIGDEYVEHEIDAETPEEAIALLSTEEIQFQIKE